MVFHRVRLSYRFVLASAFLASAGCGDDGSPAPEADCAGDGDCSDGVFCTGEERCVAGSCVAAASPPCPTPLLCNESGGRCESPGCDVARDADGDGSEAIACGGDDCDDADPLRYPSNPELCDAVDQDCDPATLGDLDADADGFVSAACCNGERCGPDCDDALAAVGPTGTETCDGVDDDCDGNVDEGVLRAFYPDIDRDNFGARDGSPTYACTRTDGLTENTLDCDDSAATVNPTGTERCDGVDNNCNGVIDDPESSSLLCTASFGSPPNTFFACDGGTCAVDDCANDHGDCNGERSDGCEVDLRTDVRHCGACGTYCGVGGECVAGACDSVVDVAAGSGYTCVVRVPSGRVVCWGQNDHAQLGDQTISTRETPVVAINVSQAVDVEVERFRAATDPCGFTCAQTSSLVYCWGCNEAGQVGDGDPEEFSLTPEPANDVPFRSGQPLVEGSLAVGAEHSCVLNRIPAFPSRSVATCWGANGLGQITDRLGGDVCNEDGFEDHCEGRDMQGRFLYPSAIATGNVHTCALVMGGVYCVGLNNSGQYGNGTTLEAGGASAVPITRSDPSVDYIDIVAGDTSTCAITAGDRRVRCWGDNSSGQLGDGTTARRLSPVDAPSTAGAESLCMGPDHTCAAFADGTAKCWGEGSAGQLGDGLAMDSRTPVTVDLTGIVQVTCGRDHSCARRSDGEIWCWGGNDTFQVGPAALGSTVPTPTRVIQI